GAESIIEAVTSGETELGVVYATEAAEAGSEVRVVEELSLPPGVEVVYSTASFSDEGRLLAMWLQTNADVATEASRRGLTPARTGRRGS
ncbi:MAG: hypothetical protein VYC34_06530, partial [Planctomycetota bacterium]|nr:hypothetical protein [Planctomycetota bacterium]